MNNIPVTGAKVKLFFKSTTIFSNLEGIVESWEDNEVVLSSPDGSKMIIPNINEHLFSVKIENPDADPLPAPIAVRVNPEQSTIKLSPLQQRLQDIANKKHLEESGTYEYPGFFKK